MRSAWIESEDYSDGRGRSPVKSAIVAVVLFVALLAAAAGIYWLVDGPSPNPEPDPYRNEAIEPDAPVQPVPTPPRPAPTPPRPVPEDSLLKAPPATCIDGRPTSDRVPVRDCV